MLREIIEEMAKGKGIKFTRLDEGDVVQGDFGGPKGKNKDFTPIEVKRILKTFKDAADVADAKADQAANRREKSWFLEMAEDFEDMEKDARYGNRGQVMKKYGMLDTEAKEILEDLMTPSIKQIVMSYLDAKVFDRVKRKI